MKRTTIISFAGAVITIVFIIGFVSFHSIRHNKRGRKKSALSEFITKRDSLKLPTAKYIHFDYVTPIEYKEESYFPISDIRIAGGNNSNQLDVPTELLSHIDIIQKGDTLMLKVDLRDKKWWTKKNSKLSKNRKVGSLFTVKLDNQITGIYNELPELKAGMNYCVESFETSVLDVKLTNCAVRFIDNHIEHLYVANAYNAFFQNVQANLVSITDQPNMKTQGLLRRKCAIDTLEIRANNDTRLSNLTKLKHLRWKKLHDKVRISCTLAEGVTIEEIKN